MLRSSEAGFRGGLAALVLLAACEAAPTSPDALRQAAAVEALTSGDTATAVRWLSEAAERIHGHSPRAVALEVLGRAEARLEGASAAAPSTRRALRLIRSAREELAAGDPVRALERALYALQLAEGRAVPERGSVPALRCPDATCPP